MSERKTITTRYINRSGIPVFEIRTVHVPASVWAGNFEYAATTTVVKFIKNR
jgi:hypothetical protein